MRQSLTEPTNTPLRPLTHLCVILLLPCGAWAMDLARVPEIPPFPSIQSNGKTYHVDKRNGNNTTGNGSSTSPWATVQYGVDQLSAGDTLTVHEGASPYNEDVDVSVEGTSDNWIRIQGADGENVTIRGGRTLEFKDSAKYVLLRNIHIQQGKPNWIMARCYGNTSHIAFDRVEFDGQSSTGNSHGVRLNAGVDHIWFRDVDVHHCGYGRKGRGPTDPAGIYIHSSKESDPTEHLTFINVAIRDNVGDGVGGGTNVSGGNIVDCVYFDGCKVFNNTGDGIDIGTKTELIVKGCEIRDNRGDQGNGIKVWSGGEAWIYNCLVCGNAYAGVVMKNKCTDLDIPVNLYLLHNTFYGNNNASDWDGEICFQNMTGEWDCSHQSVWIYNNIMGAMNAKALHICDYDGVTRIEGCDYNYYFASDKSKSVIILRKKHGKPDAGPVVGYQIDDVGEGGTWTDYSGHDAHSIAKRSDRDALSDPGFTDMANDDYSLEATSLAVDAGMDLTSEGITQDIDGRPRPQGKACDIGAHEYRGRP